jgi:hypothetical protein
MRTLKISKRLPANAPNAAKKRKSFQMNLIAPTLAVDAENPSIFQNVKSPVKAKAYPPDKRFCLPGTPRKSVTFYLENANKISSIGISKEALRSLPLADRFVHPGHISRKSRTRMSLKTGIPALLRL